MLMIDFSYWWNVVLTIISHCNLLVYPLSSCRKTPQKGRRTPTPTSTKKLPSDSIDKWVIYVLIVLLIILFCLYSCWSSVMYDLLVSISPCVISISVHLLELKNFLNIMSVISLHQAPLAVSPSLVNIDSG
jgi:hypothetical protein